MLGDVLRSGVLPSDLATARAELRVNHRVAERRFLLAYIPQDSVGAELGVFTGLFSAVLARQEKIRQVTFVDPWWLAFGEKYPSWGAYTAHGRLSTRTAHRLASARVAKAGRPGRVIEPAFSYDWLRAQPDRSLDWVYLDSTHTYDGTKAELELLDAKIKPDGVILGDDWQQDRNARHHGVCLAVNEFAKASDFEFALAGIATQWVLRRPVRDRSSMPMLVKDALIEVAARPS
jgi:hypothetical protein